MKKYSLLGLRAIMTLVTAAALTSPVLAADRLMVAAGAGYKKPVMELMKSFEKKSGLSTEGVFGNLAMIAQQVKQSGEVDLIIADRKFLEDPAPNLQFADEVKLGRGILVLAYRKGIGIKSVEDILTDSVKKVFMPKKGKAMYGTAGGQALDAYGYTEKLAAKLTEVATVPQVVQYLVTGEADAGFINLTEAMANKDKLGGYIIIPADKYREIQIVAGILKGAEKKPATRKFVEFLTSTEAAKILEKHGLK